MTLDIFGCISLFIFLFIPVMFSLKENTEEALQRDDVKAIVITGRLEKIMLCAVFMG